MAGEAGDKLSGVEGIVLVEKQWSVCMVLVYGVLVLKVLV